MGGLLDPKYRLEVFYNEKIAWRSSRYERLRNIQNRKERLEIYIHMWKTEYSLEASYNEANSLGILPGRQVFIFSYVSVNYAMIRSII